MTVYIHYDKNFNITLMCSYNPFVVYLGSTEGRTSTYTTANCPPDVHPIAYLPELFL